MAFYDTPYGGDPSRGALPRRTDAMRDARQQFRQMRNQGVLDSSSTMDARMGQSSLRPGEDATGADRRAIQDLRQDVNRNDYNTYASSNLNGQPSYSGMLPGNPVNKMEDLQGFQRSLRQRFQDPSIGNGLLTNAPSWMSAGRANNIYNRMAGKYNNALPFNPNPYQESISRSKGGQPS